MGSNAGLSHPYLTMPTRPTPKSRPDFRSRSFLRLHILDVLKFYDVRCVDPTGGYYQNFLDDGTVFNQTNRHLVGSARLVVNFAMAARLYGDAQWQDIARHGFRFLQDVHRDPDTGVYAWELEWDQGAKKVIDTSNRCYGLAFVLLAMAHSARAGIREAAPEIAAVYERLERDFWEPSQGLYADQIDEPGGPLSPYRSQETNMHLCEALVAAYEATSDPRFIDRAMTLADTVTRGLARFADGFIWEHYRADASTGRWAPDWDYNRDDPSNPYRPGGFEPGHHCEWAKLLLLLERLRPEGWLLPRARELFAAGTQAAWDGVNGGLAHVLVADENEPGRLRIASSAKYFWAQAEAIAAAALLALRTADGDYWSWYDRLWQFSWDHFVDHAHGAWYRVLDAQNQRLGNRKGVAEEVDYHTMGACYEIWSAIAVETKARR